MSARFEGRGRADLVSELTFSFPVFVIAQMLGLPSEDLPKFHRWAVEMISLPFDPELGLAGSAKLAEYFAPLVTARRADPKDDVISVLGAATLEGRSLEDQEIVDFLRFLLEAGAETTYRSSSNLFFGLLSEPEVLDEVRANRDALAAGDRGSPSLGATAHDGLSRRRPRRRTRGRSDSQGCGGRGEPRCCES